MKRKAPTACPVCGGEYEITKCTCKKCGSELGGHFSGCEFCSLSADQWHFVEIFLRNEGKLSRVQEELGLSYPTVRSRLDEVIRPLGLTATRSPEDLKEERRKIFVRLEKGKITADQAAEFLKNL